MNEKGETVSKKYNVSLLKQYFWQPTSNQPNKLDCTSLVLATATIRQTRETYR